MLDIKANELKKIVEKKKYLQVSNILKDSIITKTITKYVLNLKIKLIIDELLALT